MKEQIEIAEKCLLKNYKQQPIVLARGEGVHLWDVSGNKYLDMTAGIAVCSLGHAHAKLTATIAEQAGRLLHTSNLYYIEEQIQLAKTLTERSFADRAFFCNSGGEANEAALKLARRYQQVVAKAPDRVTIIATEGSFHGRTFATMSVTGQEKYRKNFGPLFGPVMFVPYGDIEACERALAGRTACAMIIEPVQAEGGIIVPPAGYLKHLRELCTKTGTILIFDEVQTGVGRTGTLFGYEQEDAIPDIMTLAKGLAGGIPIGAMLASEEVAKGFIPLAGEPATHASTFGGNALACAAARTVLEVIATENILENCRKMGNHLGRALHLLCFKYPSLIREARGRGLLRGIELRKDAPRVIADCREQFLLLSSAGGNTIRFAPSLLVSRDDIDDAIKILDKVLSTFGYA